MSVEQTIGVLRDVYCDLEIKQISNNLGKLDLMNEEEKEEIKEEEVDVKEIVKKLESKDYIIDSKGKLFKKQGMNKKCNCNSKTKYKNCCFASDVSRSEAFIEK
jgi:uncharacterized protein YchJ